MTATEPASKMRTVTVRYTPRVTSDKIVRFHGTTFEELQQRLLAARVPDVNSKSFMELYVPNEGFVCPLPGEHLPDLEELVVSVHGEGRTCFAQLS